MATQAQRLVRIEKDGKQSTVTEHDYKHRKMGALDGQTYQDAGYSVLNYEDGTPYEDGQTPTKYAVAKHAGAQPIGIGGSNPTLIDGSAANEGHVLDAGVEVAAKASESTPVRRAPVNAAPPAEKPAE